MKIYRVLRELIFKSDDLNGDGSTEKGADLLGANLRGADMTDIGAILRKGADLKGADLKGANLYEEGD